MGAFGKCCKEIMNKYGLKYRIIANAVGYDVSYISKWVNNDILPAAASARDICSLIAKVASDCEDGSDDKKHEQHDKLFHDLYNAYEEDEQRSTRGVPVTEREVFDRKTAIFDRLKDLRKATDVCKLTMFVDLKNLDNGELIFLIDVANYIRDLRFDSGGIYVLLPELGLDGIENGKTLVAIINLFMVQSHVKLYCYCALVSQFGMILLSNQFLYSAQCWAHKCWLHEAICDDVSLAVNALNREIMPTATELFHCIPIGHTESVECSDALFWRAYSYQLLGVLGTQFCSDELLANITHNMDADTAQQCESQRNSHVCALDAGEQIQCLIYGHAMHSLVYDGSIFAGGKYIVLGAQQRLQYLYGMWNMIQQYPNLQIRVTGEYIVRDVKHRFLPVVLFDARGCCFLTFPVDKQSAFCKVKNRGFRKSIENGFSNLWKGDNLTVYDFEEMFSEYLDECEAGLL